MYVNSISVLYVFCLQQTNNLTYYYQQNYTISGLMENEVYVFTVTAVNQVGESMINASIVIRTNGSSKT